MFICSDPFAFDPENEVSIDDRNDVNMDDSSDESESDETAGDVGGENYYNFQEFCYDFLLHKYLLFDPNVFLNALC